MGKLHLIGNAHLDPVWLWNWQEGFSEILATFRSALDRMKDFDDFKFTSACAVYYEWVEKTDPDMFEEIKQRVKEGRWQIVGGWFLQPDCNIPTGESFARHSLISQRYFEEKFGVTAKTGYNVDSFGHNASLPQILRLSGMRNYVFMRPSPSENPGLYDLFDWQSADGSVVRTYRIPDPYCITLDAHRLNVLDKTAEKAKAQSMMAFYGVGNHGGGPTIEIIKALKERELGDKVFSTPDEYFDEVKTLEVPLHKGELQHHARGCYSANSFIKKSNRSAEYSLLAAEAICSLADKLVGAEYPSAKIKKGWKNLMFNQFHDILGGCSIKSAYTDAGYLFGEIKSITEQETFKAMTKVCRRIDTLKGETLPTARTDWKLWSCGKLGSPVVIFNPHAFEVGAVVKFPLNVKKVTDDNGNVIPHQLIRAEQTNGENDKYGVAFRAEVPALGYKVYRFFPDGEEAIFDKTVKADRLSLENELIRVTFNETTGGVAEITDKRTGKAVVFNTGTALLDETNCDTWAHNRFSLGEKVGEFTEPEFEIIESGAVRAILRVTTHFGNSTLRQDHILESGSDSIRVEARIDFHEKHRALKLTMRAGENVSAAIPFGSIERQPGTGEEPCGEWIMSGQVGFASDISYGYDTTENELRPTIFRSAIYADHFGKRDDSCEYMEQGVGNFSYSLFIGSTKADAKRRADVLNSPLRKIMDSFHAGELGSEISLLEGSIPENIVVTAIKHGEDGGQVVRFAEYAGESTRTDFSLAGCGADSDVKPYQIKTFRDGKEADLIEHQLGS